jgi:ferrochelatase
LRGIILNVRPRKSAANYAKVWMPEGSPLAVYTKAQAERLQARLGGEVDVRFAMRYGEPAIARQLEAMKADGCDRILLAPLYPQYSGATTATVVDEAFRALAGYALATRAADYCLPIMTTRAIYRRWPQR